MLHASIEQRLQTNLTEQKTLWTRRICTIQHEDYILQESALHSLQKRRVNIIYRRPYKGSILKPGTDIGDIQKLRVATSENSLPARKTKPSALKAVPAMVRMCSPKDNLESKMTPRSLIDSRLVRMEPLILESNRRGLVFLVNVTMLLLHLRWLRTKLFNLHLLEISSI
jgi:hypothetical protein